MLDDDAGGSRLIEFGDAFEGGVGIVDVVVGELLALELARRGDARPTVRRAVEGRPLMRVLAIAHRLGKRAAQCAEGRRGVAELVCEPVRDRRVVSGGAGISLLRQSLAQRQRGLAAMGVEIGQHGSVIGTLDDNRDVVMVLGGGADHRRPPDIDVLDAVVIAFAGRDRRLERIEVHHQQIDRLDAMADHRGLMLGMGAHGEQSAMDLRMERLDATVHHLRKARQFRHVLNREPRIGDRFRGAAGRDQRDTALVQRTGEIDEPRLVGNGKERAFDAAKLSRHGGVRTSEE